MRVVGGVVCDRGMAIVLGTLGIDGLGEVVRALREWQYDGAAVQLHPGDLGWFWRFGDEATAAATRTWSRDGEILAVGLLDDPELLRLAIAPEAQRDEELAQRLVEDVSAPEAGVLIEGKVYVEAPMGALVQDLLSKDGWMTADPWVPLRRDLSEPVPDPGLRVDVIGAEAGARADRRPAGVVRRVDVHRRPVARDGRRRAVRRRALSRGPQPAG